MSMIKINKLVLLGCRYKRTLNFDEGLTIIRGDRTSGKSLVLSLIDYCMGKSDNIALKVQKQLDEHCDQVLLEITINNEYITLKRNLKNNQKKISIYFCRVNEISEYTPKVVDIQEAMLVIMRKLRVNEYKITKHKIHSNEQTLETISFRDIFRYVYVKQHMLGTDNFLDNKSIFKKNKNPYAFELIFNLIESDKDQLNIQLVSAKNSLENIKKEILGLSSYLKDKEAEDISILMIKEGSIKEDINKQLEEKKLIIARNDKNNSSENQTYINLKERLMELANNVLIYQKEKDELKISIASKEILLNDYKDERADIDATLEVNYHLIVDEQIIECPLCKSKVQSKLQNNNKLPQELLNKIQRDINQKIKLVKSLIDKDFNKINEFDNKILSLKREQDIFNEAISKFTRKTSVPFLSQIDSINSIVNSYNKKYENINECMRIHKKIEEKENLIEDLKNEIDNLEERIKSLKISEEKKKDIFKVLNEKYREYMKRLKYDTTNTYIDPNDYMAYHDGANMFEHESGGLLECMQISFLGAILASKDYGYAVGHPGILLFDSISKYLGTIKSDITNEDKNINVRINDPEVYEEIYKIFVELSDRYQLIIVDNTPPSIFSKYSKYTFLSGEKGLINLELNEFNYE